MSSPLVGLAEASFARQRRACARSPTRVGLPAPVGTQASARAPGRGCWVRLAEESGCQDRVPGGSFWLSRPSSLSLSLSCCSHDIKPKKRPHTRSCPLLSLSFNMPMVYDRRSWLHLSVTAPGDRKKSTSIVRIGFAPLFAHAIAASYKKGAAHHCELEMYVCDLCNQSFSTQGSLKRHGESVHPQSAGFSCRVCSQRIYRKDVL